MGRRVECFGGVRIFQTSQFGKSLFEQPGLGIDGAHIGKDGGDEMVTNFHHDAKCPILLFAGIDSLVRLAPGNQINDGKQYHSAQDSYQ